MDFIMAFIKILIFLLAWFFGIVIIFTGVGYIEDKTRGNILMSILFASIILALILTTTWWCMVG